MSVDQETRDQLTSAVRRFVRKRLLPLEQRVEDTDQFPEDVIARCANLDCLGYRSRRIWRPGSWPGR